MREVCTQIVGEKDGAPRPLTDADYELLESVGMANDALAGADLTALLVALRFLSRVPDEHMAAVVDFALSADGAALRWPLIMRLVDTRSDDVARLVVASAVDMPRDRRSYGTWKRFETFFGSRPDYVRLAHDLSTRLIELFEKGPDAQRTAIGDLFGRSDLKNEDLPALRQAEQEAWKEQEALMNETFAILDAQEADLPPMVWVEDCRGLRQVERRVLTRSQRSPVRHEIRLQTAGTNGAAPVDHGTLVSCSSDYYGEQLASQLAVLRELAASIGDTAIDLESPIGVVKVFPHKGAWSSEANAPLRPLADAMADATSWCAAMSIQVTSESPPNADHARTLQEVGRELLAAYREGTRVLHDLVTSAARGETTKANTADATKRVEAIASRAQATFTNWRNADLAAPHDVPRNMVFRHYHVSDGTKSAVLSAGHTKVAFGSADAIVAVFSENSCAMAALPRAALRDATFTLRDTAPATGSDARGCELLVTTSSPFTERQIGWPGYGPCRLQYVAARRGLTIDCDTRAHAEQLRDELRSFATGGAR